MVSRGRGCRGYPRGASQVPPVFDQQAFAEAVGITAAAIAQASAAGSQGGPSNSRDSGHIILRHSQGEEIRWWKTIGSYRSRRCWRLWRLPLTRLGSD